MSLLLVAGAEYLLHRQRESACLLHDRDLETIRRQEIGGT